jgi:hypothetical protein
VSYFCRERTTRPAWSFAPLESHRLTEQDITDFVNCIKEYVFISIFNKDYAEEAVEACQYLSILRSELIIPVIVEKYGNFFLRFSYIVKSRFIFVDTSHRLIV